MHLPSSAFLQCADSNSSHNTLFEGVDPRHVKLPELKEYLDLIVGFFELSPEGRSLLCDARLS